MTRIIRRVFRLQNSYDIQYACKTKKIKGKKIKNETYKQLYRFMAISGEYWALR